MTRLTIYGKNPVLEALESAIAIERLHVASDQRRAAKIADILQRAAAQGIDVEFHSRRSLSFISGNGKQDQGIAADVIAPALKDLDAFLADPPDAFSIIALERVDNPQNLGMAVRSIHAAGAIGLVAIGKPRLHPLAIKASAGVLLHAALINADTIDEAIGRLRDIGTAAYVLDASASVDLFDHTPPARAVYIIGNETDGVTAASRAAADGALAIPLADGVESLNAAVSAALVAFVANRTP